MKKTMLFILLLFMLAGCQPARAKYTIYKDVLGPEHSMGVIVVPYPVPEPLPVPVPYPDTFPFPPPKARWKMWCDRPDWILV